jgi:hypothetical protein
MMRAVRFSRFRGCTGDVQLSFNDNNRKGSMFSGYQVLLEDGEPNLYRVLDISITNSPTFRDFKPVIWYDNTNSTPNYERYTYKDCPFPEEWRLSLPYSQARTAWTMLGFVVTVTVIAVVAKWRFFRFQTLKDIPRPILLSTQDMFIFVISLFEPLQYLVLAPSQRFLNAVSRDLFKNAFWNDIDFKDGKFWLFINSLLAVCGVWLSFLVIALLALRRNSHSSYQALLFILSRLGNFAFILGLLTTFDCKEGASEFDDSNASAVMDVDCYETCWEGKHLSYVIGVSLILVTYCALSVAFNNHFSLTLEGHQFVTSPTYQLLRIVVQLALIALYKSRTVLGGTAYAGMYLAILLVNWLGVSLKKCINVPSLNLWHSTVHLIVLYVTLIGVLQEGLWSNILTGLACVLIGIFLILIVVKFKQARLPKLVLKPPPIDREKWFAFAFRPTNAESLEWVTENRKNTVIEDTSPNISSSEAQPSHED